ncbi:hypothetical protein PIB30_012240 [Stylosanthes scabra]|uniref:Uncharacterized protein n=1 Tax=Stylosanthes scabra TaxID=79078 RepID=A0ABU6V9B1_9FABA|nr:hypothetical protein [Stylosanthes scabra]
MNGIRGLAPFLYIILINGVLVISRFGPFQAKPLAKLKTNFPSSWEYPPYHGLVVSISDPFGAKIEIRVVSLNLLVLPTWTTCKRYNDAHNDGVQHFLFGPATRPNIVIAGPIRIGPMEFEVGACGSMWSRWADRVVPPLEARSGGTRKWWSPPAKAAGGLPKMEGDMAYQSKEGHHATGGSQAERRSFATAVSSKVRLEDWWFRG